MAFELLPHQQEAVKKMSNGKILYGGVGTGKTFTALSYYLQNESDRDIIVITTPKVRDSEDWIDSAAKLAIGPDRDSTIAGTLTIDSWNKISRYTEEEGKFFIFDEQRLVGSGAWVKSFLKIAKKNNWIILSGTPGDTWMDYAAVFIANGYYSSFSDFKRQHVHYASHVKFPSIIGYFRVGQLERLRNEVLVEMPFERHTTRHVNWLECDHDSEEYLRAVRTRWNPFKDEPMSDVAELARVLRRLVNSDDSRMEEVKKLMKLHPRLIIFYSFNYELELLRELHKVTNVYEWNGHRKDQLPEGTDDEWVYLVQYTSGAEGWNCITTNAMVFYSMTYSYKAFDQAMGRTDRLNTGFSDLYYYVLLSTSKMDQKIKGALQVKKDFNERRFATKYLM